MREMEQLAKDTVSMSSEMSRLAQCIRAENFYFELDNVPNYKNGSYECAGRVLCRLDPTMAEHVVFLEELDRNSASLKLGSRILSGRFQGRQATQSDGSFYRAVKFYVPTKKTQFRIELTEASGLPCGISGSPFTIDDLIKAQGLDSWFGTADHKHIVRR
jgi:hypothetical protein